MRNERIAVRWVLLRDVRCPLLGEEGRGLCTDGGAAPLIPLGQLWLTQPSSLWEQDEAAKPAPPIHILTDTHGGCCWRLANHSWFPPGCAGGSWAVLGSVRGCSTSPCEQNSIWGGRLPQAGLGWAQCFGHDYRQDFGILILSPRCYPGTGAEEPDRPMFVKTFFSEAKLFKMNGLLINVISMCFYFSMNLLFQGI